MNGICIFGASSQRVNEQYKIAAIEIGELLAENGYELVFGAGAHGLMGAVAKGAASKQGKIIGVIPEKLNLPGIASPLCTQLIVTPTMHQRKQTMESMSKGFIAVAGGFGTFEELLEVITLKQLGYMDLPIVILNTNGYYNSLISMFERCVNEGFADKKYLNLYYVAETPKDAIEYIKAYQPTEMPDKMLEVLRTMAGEVD